MRTRRGMHTAVLRRGRTRIPIAVAGSIALTVAGSLPAAAEPRTTSAEPQNLQAQNLQGQSLHARSLHAQERTAGASFRMNPDSDVVRPGDTVSAIAARHGLRTEDVLRLNGLDWSSIIQPGQVLRLTAPAAPTAPASTGYTIRPGDTIVAIARAHGVGVQTLLDTNGLDWSSIIYPGQVVQIPGTPAPAPAPEPVASQTPVSSAYTVRGGDTVSAIASAHGLITQSLLDANGLGWSSIIYPGQVLQIPGGTAPAPAPAAADLPGLDAEQIENARLIIRIGRELGVSDRGIAIALGTAMQESWIRNLDWGDRDSLGLFQQRPSTGWGTAEQVRDRDRSIRVFFGGPSDPNGSRTRGLLDIPGWEQMSFAAAAQSVQISAFPDRYARWEQPAYGWLAALG